MEVTKELHRAIERIMGVEIEAMGGDNLAVLLCGHFDDPDDGSDIDDTGWSQSAVDAYDAIKAEIAKLFVPVHTALATAQTEAAELRAEVERLREALRSTQWTVANQNVAKALCEAVACCALGPSDDDGTLTLYDIIPDVWCVPDRFAATNDIAEQIAFTALEAWLTAARAALAQGTQPHE